MSKFRGMISCVCTCVCVCVCVCVIITVLPCIFVSQSAWINQQIYDLIHPDDMEKVRDQLCPTESPDAGRVLDIKSE